MAKLNKHEVEVIKEYIEEQRIIIKMLENRGENANCNRSVLNGMYKVLCTIGYDYL